jgi:hypothetical protein
VFISTLESYHDKKKDISKISESQKKKEIQSQEIKDDVCSPYDLVLKFFKSFPKYPVVRLTINPSETYIAPTQNVIHDGIGSSTTPDLHLTICGHIGFSQLWDHVDTNHI